MACGVWRPRIRVSHLEFDRVKSPNVKLCILLYTYESTGVINIIFAKQIAKILISLWQARGQVFSRVFRQGRDRATISEVE